MIAYLMRSPRLNWREPLLPRKCAVRSSRIICLMAVVSNGHLSISMAFLKEKGPPERTLGILSGLEGLDSLPALWLIEAGGL